jgi:sugar-phosphatase
MKLGCPPRPDDRMRLVIDALALLVDCDGTLVDSTVVVERHWEEFAHRRGLNLTQILPGAHGRRSQDVIAGLVGASEVNEETNLFERREARDTVGIRAMPGAELARTLPSAAWAIVTSGSRAVAAARLVAAGLPIPQVLVSGDDVARGKPEPDAYLLAASALGINPANCVAIEDTPAGIAAGRAAGCTVLALTTTHSAEQLGEADLVLPDLTHIIVERAGSGLRVHADSDGTPK